MKKKKYRIVKFISLIIVTSVITILSFTSMINKNINISNESFLTLFLSEGNHNFLYEYKPLKVINKVVTYFSNIDLNNPVTILNSGLMYEEVTTHNDDYSNLKELSKVSHYINNPNENDTDPNVYIYNTHQLEQYNANNLNPYNITPNVMMASYIMQELLNKEGLKSYVEEANFTEELNTYNYNYSHSYKISRMHLESAKKKMPNLGFYIDLHRDSVKYKVTTTEFDGKKYARILFVLGLENKNYKANLETMEVINQKIVSKYPTLSRGIYKKEGAGVNGVYNQDFDGKVILLEVGGVDNTIEEVNNTLELITPIIAEYIKSL